MTTIALIGGLGMAFWWLDAGREAAIANALTSEPASPVEEPAGERAVVSEAEPLTQQGAHGEAMARRFRQGVLMLHAREYEHAAVAFQQVLDLQPRLPEAQVNMGFALLGLGRVDLARDFFRVALDLRPTQRNAYYGLAESLEALGDRPGAIGAMRTFVHLSPADAPFVRKARSALWEWQPARGRAAAGQDRWRGEGQP
jgi:tetratricopeptide (TPR) repeat protein